jgi:hypothetical protein
MIELSPEAQFWVIINVILLALIATLTSNLIRRRRVGKLEKSLAPLSVSWISTLDHLLRSRGPSEAIIVTFNKVLDDLKGYLGLSLSRGSTSREAVLAICSRLSEGACQSLMRLYEIYEPVRFGGGSARREDLDEFRRTLIKLISEIRLWRSRS